MYHRPGWVTHIVTSIWRNAQPIDFGACPCFWPMGSGWFCQHLWEHYQFTGDRRFLRETAYPIMKGSAEFYDSWLVEDENGCLLTPVSTSPENLFEYIDSEGKKQMSGLTMGSTLDIAIIRELFSNTISAANLLSEDAVFRDRLATRATKLLPYRVGSRGQLVEWFKQVQGCCAPASQHISVLSSLSWESDHAAWHTRACCCREEASGRTRQNRREVGQRHGWRLHGARLNHAETGYGYLRASIQQDHAP